MTERNKEAEVNAFNVWWNALWAMEKYPPRLTKQIVWVFWEAACAWQRGQCSPLSPTNSSDSTES